jgi:hypothetical protein
MAKEGAIGGNISVGENVTGAALTSGANWCIRKSTPRI